jgi:superfamily II DNA or RNA helicase
LATKDELENLIIFVSPQQKEHVKEILNEKGIFFHQLTQEEGTTPKPQYGGKTERQYIIQKFIEKRYKALVAIKCLDEGIDIPTAARGILMASSTNPREYVQRIGRIIRQEASKSYAYLYDICVESSGCFVDVGIRDIDARIRQKELARLKDIAELAINSADALKNIFALN